MAGLGTLLTRLEVYDDVIEYVNRLLRYMEQILDTTTFTVETTCKVYMEQDLEDKEYKKEIIKKVEEKYEEIKERLQDYEIVDKEEFREEIGARVVNYLRNKKD